MSYTGINGDTFDELFAPIGSSTPRADVGYSVVVGGVVKDIAQVYMASTGGDNYAPTSGFKSSLAGGQDLSSLFRYKYYVEPEPLPEIISVSNNGPVYRGENITLTCVATGAASCIWLDDGIMVGSGFTLVLDTTFIADGTTFTCVVENSSDGAVFGSTTVTILPLPDTTISLTGPTTVTAGSFNGETWNFSASNAAGLVQVRFQISGHSSGSWTPVTGTSYSGSITWSDPLGFPSISNTPGTYHFSFEAQAGDASVALATLSVTVL